MAVSWQSPEEALRSVKEYARRVRRKAWMAVWQAPLAMALGVLPSQPDTELVLGNTPHGPVWHRGDVHVPSTVFAFTRNGQPIKTFPVVYDSYQPMFINVEQLTSDYVKKKTEALMNLSYVAARLCDAVTEEPQRCITIVMPGSEPVSREYTVQNEPEYLDRPFGYEVLTPYKIRSTGSMTWLYISGSGVPEEWVEPDNEQPYFNVELHRGRLAINARDGDGNEGLLADTGYMVIVSSGVDVPVHVKVPPLLDFTIDPYTTIIQVVTNTWTAMWRIQ